MQERTFVSFQPTGFSGLSRRLQNQLFVTGTSSGKIVRLHTNLPHLISLAGAKNGATLMPLPEGRTTVGTSYASARPDIVLAGFGVESQHCAIVNHRNVVSIVPFAVLCAVNGRQINTPTRLSQGCMLCLGRSNYFRFNQHSTEQLTDDSDGRPGGINSITSTFTNGGAGDVSTCRSGDEKFRDSLEGADFARKLDRFELLSHAPPHGSGQRAQGDLASPNQGRKSFSVNVSSVAGNVFATKSASSNVNACRAGVSRPPPQIRLTSPPPQPPPQPLNGFASHVTSSRLRAPISPVPRRRELGSTVIYGASPKSPPAAPLHAAGNSAVSTSPKSPIFDRSPSARVTRSTSGESGSKFLFHSLSPTAESSGAAVAAREAPPVPSKPPSYRLPGDVSKSESNSASPEPPSRNQLVTASKLRSATIEISPPRTVETVVTKTILVNGSPSRNAVNGSPSRNAVNGSPSRNAVNGPPSRNAVNGSPSRNAVNGPPSRNAVHGSPSRNAVNGPPSRNAVNGSPSRNAVNGSPSRNAVNGSPSRNADNSNAIQSRSSPSNLPASFLSCRSHGDSTRSSPFSRPQFRLNLSGSVVNRTAFPSPSSPRDVEDRVTSALRLPGSSSRFSGSPPRSPVRVATSSSDSQQRPTNGNRNVVLVQSGRGRVTLTGRRDAQSPTPSLNESLGELNLENFKGEKVFTKDTAVTRVQLVASPSPVDRPSELRRPTSPYTFLRPVSPPKSVFSGTESRTSETPPSPQHRPLASALRSMSPPPPPLQRAVVANGPASLPIAKTLLENTATSSNSHCPTASGGDVVTMRSVSPVVSSQWSNRHAVSVYDNVNECDSRSPVSRESPSRTDRVTSTASSSSFTSVSSMSSSEPSAALVDSQSPPLPTHKTLGIKVLPTSHMPPSSPSVARRTAQQFAKFSPETGIKELSPRSPFNLATTNSSGGAFGSGTSGSTAGNEVYGSDGLTKDTIKPLLSSGIRGKTGTPGSGKSVTFVLENRCGDIDICEADSVSLDSLEMTEDELTASQQDLRQQHAFQRQERRREQAQAAAERQRLEDILAMCEEYERELEHEMNEQQATSGSTSSASNSVTTATAKTPPLSFSRSPSAHSDSSTSSVASNSSSPITGRSPNATTNRIKTNGSLNKVSPTPQHREVGSFDFWRRRSSNSSASEEDSEGTIKRRPTTRPMGSELHVGGDRFAEHPRLVVGSQGHDVGDSSEEWLDCLDSAQVPPHSRPSAGTDVRLDDSYKSTLQSSGISGPLMKSRSSAVSLNETNASADRPSEAANSLSAMRINTDEKPSGDVPLQVRVASASSEAPRSPAGSDGSSDTPSGGTTGNDAVTASSSGVETSSEHSLTNGEDGDVGSRLAKLVAQRSDCLQNIAAFKQRITEIESQENENILELEMERALLEGEHQTEMGELQAEQKRISFLKKRQLQLIEAACSERDKEQSLIEAEREKLHLLEVKHRAMRRQLEICTDRNKLLQEIGKLQEHMESQRKKFDDMEFQQLEVETRYEEEREKVQQQLMKEQNDMLDKYRVREEKLQALDMQQREMLRQVKSDIESLELNRQTLVDRFRQEKKHLSGLDMKIRELNRTLVEQRNSSEVELRSSNVVAEANLTTPTERSRPQICDPRALNAAAAAAVSSGRNGRVEWNSITRTVHQEDSEDSSVNENEPVHICKLSEMERQLANQKSPGSQHKQEAELSALELERNKRIKLEELLRQETMRRDEMIEQEIRLRESSKIQARPLTRYLPVRDSEFNLRQHIESAGHTTDDTSSVFVDANACRGFLQKMGAKFRNWNKRWFVFDRCKRTLSYYIDRSESRVRGAIYFQAIEEVYVDHQRTVKSPNPKLTFCVKTRDRFYYLLAPTAEAMRVWIDVIFTGAEGYQEYLDS